MAIHRLKPAADGVPAEAGKAIGESPKSPASEAVGVLLGAGGGGAGLEVTPPTPLGHQHPGDVAAEYRPHANHQQIDRVQRGGFVWSMNIHSHERRTAKGSADNS